MRQQPVRGDIFLSNFLEICLSEPAGEESFAPIVPA
jgi:hypothetical protein